MRRERIFLFLSFFLSSFLRRATTTSKSCVSTVSVFRLRRVDDEFNALQTFFLFFLSSDFSLFNISGEGRILRKGFFVASTIV